MIGVQITVEAVDVKFLCESLCRTPTFYHFYLTPYTPGVAYLAPKLCNWSLGQKNNGAPVKNLANTLFSYHPKTQ
ncbi:hypothetical protein O9G_005670 [Rozella allomycis CSF55]|uniref:Uncharacterized protein n=1 Tax=Rozella allomycis (strain CSF55) TaxID=988480 RepID=A0A075AXB9_ROZAC|nr:hypothetical protein O9G_005670 [Rozella allomycis CSF55]|eukprot:EPZ34789.1 hypothetical protein O9G_005670 [Rozella allomycis CSF55]